MRKLLFFFLAILLFSMVVFAVDFIPQGDIEGLGIYNIQNFNNITSHKFCDFGGSCVNVSTLNFTDGGSGNCSVSGSCSSIVYNSILDNDTIIRVVNTSWVVLNEDNPVNSTITITESQVSDLSHFTVADEDNPTNETIHPILNNVENPDSDKTFNLATNSISWLFTNPMSDGFTIEASGAYEGDLVRIRQLTGNPSSGFLLDLIAEDPDVVPVEINGTGDTAVNINYGNISIFNGGLYASDWSNVSVNESQIVDLNHTVDTNVGFNDTIIRVGNVSWVRANQNNNCSGDGSCSNVAYNSDVLNNRTQLIGYIDSNFSQLDGDVQSVNGSVVHTSGDETVDGIKTFLKEVIFLGGFSSVNATDNVVNSSFNATDAGGVTQVFLNALGDSYFNGGNVGIGTDSPSEKLDVVGNINIGDGSGASSLFINGISTANKAIDFQSAGVSQWRLFQHSNSGDFRINRYNTAGVFQGTPFVVNQTTGNVGIGTTTPTSSLNIYSTDTGTEDLIIDSNFPEFSLNRISDSGRTYMNVNSAGGILTLTDSAGNDDVFISPYGTSYFNGGNVGIGTTTPSALLHLYTNKNDMLVLESSDSVSDLILSDTTGTAGMRGNGGELSLWTGGGASGSTMAEAGSQRVTIDSDGNVGIGTTTPKGSLHVSSGSGGAIDWGIGGQTQVDDFIVEGSSHTGISIVGGGDEFSKRIVFGDEDSNIFDGRIEYVNGEMRFYSSGAQNAVIDQFGQVGIGVASPSETLDVNGDIGIRDGGVLRFEDTAGNFDGVLQYASNNILIGQSIAAGNNIQLRTGAVARATVDSSGLDVTENLTAGRVILADDDLSCYGATDCSDGQIFWNSSSSELTIKVN